MTFIKTAALITQCPEHNLPEVAVVGRSNAGKSSLLNALVGRKKLAFVSGSPGKTRHLNFFNVDDKYVLVDLPGYGFAKRPKDEQEDWQTLIESYFTQRQQLTGLILVMDGRRDWSEDEDMIVRFTESLNVRGLVALSKADKMNQKEKSAQQKKLKISSCPWSTVWISNTKKTGIKDLENLCFQSFVQPHLK